MKITIFLFYFVDPPGPPEIRLYNDGETIRMGQSVTLSCISHGGNPLAQIFWYKKDGDRWREVDMSYNTYGRESRNSFTFLASPSHNQAKFRCEAKNEMNLSPMTSEIVLSVQCKQNVYNFLIRQMNKTFNDIKL